MLMCVYVSHSHQSPSHVQYINTVGHVHCEQEHIFRLIDFIFDEYNSVFRFGYLESDENLLCTEAIDGLAHSSGAAVPCRMYIILYAHPER